MSLHGEWDNCVENYTKRIISPFFSDETIQYLLTLLPLHSFCEQVLDIGCGKGYLLNLFDEHLSENVQLYGIDISSPMLCYARKSYRHNNALYCLSSADTCPFPDNSFNVITAINSIIMQEPMTRMATFKEIVRLLKPSGTFVAILPSLENHFEQIYYIKKYLEDKGCHENDAVRMIYDDLNTRLYDPIGGYINIEKEHIRIKLYLKTEIAELLLQTGFKTIHVKPFLYSESLIDEFNLIHGPNGIYDWYITASFD